MVGESGDSAAMFQEVAVTVKTRIINSTVPTTAAGISILLARLPFWTSLVIIIARIIKTEIAPT